MAVRACGGARVVDAGASVRARVLMRSRAPQLDARTVECGRTTAERDAVLARHKEALREVSRGARAPRVISVQCSLYRLRWGNAFPYGRMRRRTLSAVRCWRGCTARGPRRMRRPR